MGAQFRRIHAVKEEQECRRHTHAPLSTDLAPEPITISTFTNAVRPPSGLCVFWCATSSKTGSISLQGPQVAEVKNTIAAWCDCKSPCNEEVFVQMWIGAATVELPSAGEQGRDVGADSELEV